jgi:hypothetical protein
MDESDFLLTKIMERLGSTAPIGIGTLSAIVASNMVLCLVKANSLVHEDFDAYYSFDNGLHKMFILYDAEKTLDDYCSILVHEMTHWGQVVDRDFILSIDNEQTFSAQYLEDFEMPAYYAQALYETELLQHNGLLSNSKFSEGYIPKLLESNLTLTNQRKNFYDLYNNVKNQSLGKSIIGFAQSRYPELLKKLEDPNFVWAPIATSLPIRNDVNIPPSSCLDNNGDTVEYVSGEQYAGMLVALYNLQAYTRS